MQARASAVEEIMASGLVGDQLEDDLPDERLDAEVEVRLAKLSRDLRRPVL